MLGGLTSDEIAGVVRTAFDPAARGEVNRILAHARTGAAHARLGWADAGPVGAAMGAGVCLISLFVTVTVIDTERLPQAIATTEAAAESSKIRLRRMTFSQAAGFAATLPCGVCPAELSRRMPH